MTGKKKRCHEDTAKIKTNDESGVRTHAVSHMRIEMSDNGACTLSLYLKHTP